MKTDYVLFDDRKLPAYLGFGIMDENSVRFENDVINCNYVFECDQSLVHEITWEKNSCEFNSYCHGRSGYRSIHRDPQQALLRESMLWNLAEDDRFLFLSKEVCRLGNIYVNHPKRDEKKPVTSFYPAGRLFSFTLPMFEKKNDYEGFLHESATTGMLKFFRERKGLLLLQNHNETVTVRQIILADFIAPLARLQSAARFFVNAGIIQKEKHLRLMVNEACESENTFLHAFPGNENYLNFGICFQDFEKDKYQNLAEMFSIQAAMLSLRKSEKENK